MDPKEEEGPPTAVNIADFALQNPMISESPIVEAILSSSIEIPQDQLHQIGTTETSGSTAETPAQDIASSILTSEGADTFAVLSPLNASITLPATTSDSETLAMPASNSAPALESKSALLVTPDLPLSSTPVQTSESNIIIGIGSTSLSPTSAQTSQSAINIAMSNQQNNYNPNTLQPPSADPSAADGPAPTSDAALTSRSSSDFATKRTSVSSMYSLASARGIPSSAASANSSESGARGHSGPTSVAAVTSHNHMAGHEAVKRAQPTTSREGGAPSGRERSRANRRFSQSTGASSHSPSSDRPYHHHKSDVKPSAWGTIGICALDVKARSKPSRSILNRLISNREFDVVVFGDKTILDEDVENWPLWYENFSHSVTPYLVHAPIRGFPLDKAIFYVKLRRPFCVNDVPMQKILWDRRLCLQLLNKVGVPTPARVEVTRDGGGTILTPELRRQIKDVTGITIEPNENGSIPIPQNVEMIEDGDAISVDGKVLRKPFVEKPTSGEDHNIIIYYPKSSGGGARKLFRKIGNKSSEYIAELSTPRAIIEPNSSYIYEQFTKVDNAEDVKAYTVGPNYCHAETRKSPVVDGIVRRNTHGKEIRYVTALTPDEKEIASKISRVFGQRVCGFDLLRASGKSFVIDVNGWSFVKDNDDYYDHCASILKDLFVKDRIRRNTTLPSPSLSENDSRTGTGKDHTIFDGEHLDRKISRTDSTATSTAVPASNASVKSIRIQNSGEATQAPSVCPSVKSMLLDHPPHVNTAGEENGPKAEEIPPPVAPPLPKTPWKLKGIVSVIRHADRTPKQKYKFTFHTEPFIALLKGHQEEVLLIGEAALASVRHAVDRAIAQGIEDPAKLKLLQTVLIKKGPWPGTKVQIKPMFRKKTDTPDETAPTDISAPLVLNGGVAGGFGTVTVPTAFTTIAASGRPMPPVDRRPHRQDSLSGVTMSRITAAEDGLVLDKLQLIVKWGGEPTHSARYQAQELGSNMRNDITLLNHDVLDEVHIYSNSERRVTTSAHIWASAFMGQKLPDDFIKIRKDLLDDSNAAKDEMNKVKKKLKGLLREGNERPQQFAWPPKFPEPYDIQKRVVALMKFHRKVMHSNYKRLEAAAAAAAENPASSGAQLSSASTKDLDVTTTASVSSTPPSTTGIPTSTPGSTNMLRSSDTKALHFRWCCGEDTDLFRERWEKLFIEFCDNEKVDPSKISELYDTMKFDALHNRTFLEWVFKPSRAQLEEEFGIVLPDKNKEKEEERVRLEKEREEEEKRNKAAAQGGVRRLFRSRSFLNQFRHFAESTAPRQPPPEQYFHIEEGNTQNKAKVGAEFEPLRELYHLAKVLFDFICPQEYGISDAEKLEIGLLTSLPLLKEIVHALEEMQASDDCKSFFYFTKESHIYTLLNCILEGGIETKISRSTIPELDYLSQISFELYESEITRKFQGPVNAPTAAVENVTEGISGVSSADGAANASGNSSSDAEKTEDEAHVPIPGQSDETEFAYSIRISISPGCHVLDPLDVQLDSKHCISCAPRRSLTPHADWQEVIKTLRAKFNQVRLPKSFIAINLSEAFSLSQPQAQPQAALEDKNGKQLSEGSRPLRLQNLEVPVDVLETSRSNAVSESVTPAESAALLYPHSTTPTGSTSKKEDILNALRQQILVEAATRVIDAAGEEPGAGDVIAGEVDAHGHVSPATSDERI